LINLCGFSDGNNTGILWHGEKSTRLLRDVSIPRMTKRGINKIAPCGEGNKQAIERTNECQRRTFYKYVERKGKKSAIRFTYRQGEKERSRTGEERRKLGYGRGTDFMLRENEEGLRGD